jgi:hypothetical protein
MVKWSDSRRHCERLLRHLHLAHTRPDGRRQGVQVSNLSHGAGIASSENKNKTTLSRKSIDMY